MTFRVIPAVLSIVIVSGLFASGQPAPQAMTGRNPLDIARVLAARYPAQPIMSYIPALSWSGSLRLAALTGEDRWREKPRAEMEAFLSGKTPAIAEPYRLTSLAGHLAFADAACSTRTPRPARSPRRRRIHRSLRQGSAASAARRERSLRDRLDRRHVHGELVVVARRQRRARRGRRRVVDDLRGEAAAARWVVHSRARTVRTRGAAAMASRCWASPKRSRTCPRPGPIGRACSRSIASTSRRSPAINRMTAAGARSSTSPRVTASSR